MSDLTGNPHARIAQGRIEHIVEHQITERRDDLLIAQINALLAVAWEIRTLRDHMEARDERQWDAAHPAPPCPVCGGPSNGGKCRDCREVLGERP